MGSCPKCGRSHRGLCGIPPTVSLGIGIGIGSFKARRSSGWSDSGPRVKPMHEKPKNKKVQPDVNTLERLLEEGKKHYIKVVDLLKSITPDMPEEYKYAELLDQESKLNQIIIQIIGQIAAREGIR